MLHPPAGSDDLEEVRELNRLFLDYVRACARAGADCLGLDRATAALLESASCERLDALAAIPRALFRLTLPRAKPLGVMDPPANAVETSRQALQLTIAHSAWHMSRRRPYAARLFLGLDEHEIRTLRGTTLFDLPHLAASVELVGCAFPHAAWLWHKLLTETRPESLRHLLLIALQPRLPTPLEPSRLLGQQASA